MSLHGGNGQGDLFRRYPFPLRGKILKRLELVEVGGRDINVIQAEQLVVNHWLLSGLLAAIALKPGTLDWIDGPKG